MANFFSIRTKIAKRKLKNTHVYHNKITIIFIYSDRKKLAFSESASKFLFPLDLDVFF